MLDKKPEVGDVVFGRISQISRHQRLKNRSRRIHQINVGASSLFFEEGVRQAIMNIGKPIGRLKG
ncbi:MAG: hypothetical protein ACI8UO_006752 [Verrucomicrobiales bacterium]|jgi:hypothetical protein